MPFTAGNTDYGTNFGNEFATTALDTNFEAKADIWCRDFLQNLYQDSQSHVDGYVVNGTGYAE